MIDLPYLEKVATKYRDAAGNLIKRVSSHVSSLTGIADKAEAAKTIKREMALYRATNKLKQLADKGAHDLTEGVFLNEILPNLDESINNPKIKEYLNDLTQAKRAQGKVMKADQEAIIKTLRDRISTKGQFDAKKIGDFESSLRSNVLKGEKRGLTYQEGQKNVRYPTFRGHVINGYAGSEKERAFMEIERRVGNEVDDLLLKRQQGAQSRLERITNPIKGPVKTPENYRRASLEEGLKRVAANNKADINHRSIIMGRGLHDDFVDLGLKSKSYLKRLRKDIQEVTDGATYGKIFQPTSQKFRSDTNQYLKMHGLNPASSEDIVKPLGFEQRQLIESAKYDSLTPKQKHEMSVSPVAKRVSGEMESYGIPYESEFKIQGLHDNIKDPQYATPDLFSGRSRLGQQKTIQNATNVFDDLQNQRIPLFDALNNKELIERLKLIPQ